AGSGGQNGSIVALCFLRAATTGGDGGQAAVRVRRAGQQAERLLVFQSGAIELAFFEEHVGDQRMGGGVAGDVRRGCAEFAQRRVEIAPPQEHVAGGLVHATRFPAGALAEQQGERERER